MLQLVQAASPILFAILENNIFYLQWFDLTCHTFKKLQIFSFLLGRFEFFYVISFLIHLWKFLPVLAQLLQQVKLFTIKKILKMKANYIKNFLSRCYTVQLLLLLLLLLLFVFYVPYIFFTLKQISHSSHDNFTYQEVPIFISFLCFVLTMVQIFRQTADFP